ncbi:glycoside hydrolase family 99-like domain-containing protein [Pyrococcus abyssi]|uniref:Uncharacterized protein n=1 Tax=Pyrococcus abyssi (strain GE5 / Orsay) TaxID=272844 RepID=Q9V2I7_PYRAB|nr:glycoside hydrolase family 99-like domain-containing protein [Pyrococcus abyssi]CAB49011.1 Hypothetical protein PAB2287 [Pyrococcus abyssi GE5]CCE69463.1 TPA: hypothetical protein PAB2287 [Pyrococcus abyssi GE5]
MKKRFLVPFVIFISLVIMALLIKNEPCIQNIKSETATITVSRPVTTTVTMTKTTTKTVTMTKTIPVTKTNEIVRTVTATITKSAIMTKTRILTLTLTTIKKPPEIKYMEIFPNKTPDDKITTFKLSFYIIGNGTIEGKVIVTPVYYPNLNIEYEKQRVFKISGGGFHKINIPINGGKEYFVTIEACNEVGCSKKEMKTPYYREYNNLAKELKEKGIIISAVYMPHSASYFCQEAEEEPLLGCFEDTSLDIVQWKHIDWANGHGISVFWVDWTMLAWTSSKWRTLEVTRKLLEKNMTIGIMIGPISFTEIPIDLARHLGEYLEIVEEASKFMNYPSYYKIGGRPALFIWSEVVFSNRGNFYRKVYEVVKNQTGSCPYIIADLLPRIGYNFIIPGFSSFKEWYMWAITRKDDGGDVYIGGYTGWIGFYGVHKDDQGEYLPKEEFRKNFLEYYKVFVKEWRKFAEGRGKCFIPTVSPGFEKIDRPGFIDYKIPRDPVRFKKMLEYALENIGSCAEIRIDTWNDFYEGTYVEPSENEEFKFLNTLRNLLVELSSP